MQLSRGLAQTILSLKIQGFCEAALKPIFSEHLLEYSLRTLLMCPLQVIVAYKLLPLLFKVHNALIFTASPLLLNGIISHGSNYL